MPRLAILALTLLALAGCADMPPLDALQAKAGLVQAPPPPDPKTQMAALESRIVLLVRDQRRRIDPKAKPLALDAELTAIARARAADMAAKNYLAHAAPNGDTSATLLMAADAKFQGLLGENLAAQHYTAQSGVDPVAFAQRFLDTWLQSKPHKDNLAFPDYDRTGVGAAVNGDTVYVAQLFAADPGLGPRSAATVSSFDSPGAAKAATPPPAAPAMRLRGAIGDGR